MNSSKTTSLIVNSSTYDEFNQYNSTNPCLICEESIPIYKNPANYQKNECFMKSPLTVYNHCHVKGVIQNAYFMRQELEMRAIAFKASTGIYIRPIVLFVLKNQTTDTESELKRIKQDFINSGIPEEQLKLKTNSCDELHGISLTSETCEVRYILTITNLTEPWRCPFAYIIASLEDRNMANDLSTVLNYLLPLPANIKINHTPFNKGYIIVATSKFYTVVNHMKKHLDDLDFDSEKFILFNSMIELLKDMSIWEVLAKENEDVKRVTFGEGKRSFEL